MNEHKKISDALEFLQDTLGKYGELPEPGRKFGVLSIVLVKQNASGDYLEDFKGHLLIITAIDKSDPLETYHCCPIVTDYSDTSIEGENVWVEEKNLMTPTDLAKAIFL